MPAGLANLIPLVLLIVVMYFLMIRPQKKKDKQIQDMRKALTVGDEIVTIGGICGKIVKTKEDSFIIQVGADKVKFEMMRWAVSSVTKPSARREDRETVVEDEACLLYTSNTSINYSPDIKCTQKAVLWELSGSSYCSAFTYWTQRLCVTAYGFSISSSNKPK